MLAECVNLLMCAALGLVTVLIFRPEGRWARIGIGAAMGFLMWLVKVTTIWMSYGGAN